MSVLQVLEAAVGAAIVAITLWDIFNGVVVPRPTPRRVSAARLVIRVGWRAWRAIGVRRSNNGRREAFLGIFGPVALMSLLIVWLASELVGYGLLVHAFRSSFSRPPGLVDSFWTAATALLTLGTGDSPVTGIAGRAVVGLGAASGLGTVALLITLLFSLFANLQRREALVVTLDARAGAPPSGVTLLETCARLKMQATLPGLFAQWERWSAEVLDNHLAYPILLYFRSSHDNESWISALGAVLDAALLTVTTLDDIDKGPALMMIEMGNHLVEDLADQLRIPADPMVGVEREEYEDARARLSAAGYALMPVEAAWTKFSSIRGRYAYRLNRLAQYLATPPAQWIGDRSMLRPHH
jgi:hypothetical protein